MSGPSISIFIPAYNVSAFLSKTVERIPISLWDRVISCWIINDGSSDDTKEVADRLKLKNSRIKSVNFSCNHGYGTVVKEGLFRCRDDGAEYTVCLHGDGQYPAESIGEFVSYMSEKEIDILQGSRHSGKGALKGGMPLYKFIAGKILTAVENRVFDLFMTDYHSGFICYSAGALNGIPFEKLGKSFHIDLEMIASAKARGLRIAERPIPTNYGDEISHLSPVKYGLSVLNVLRLYRKGVYGEGAL